MGTDSKNSILLRLDAAAYAKLKTVAGHTERGRSGGMVHYVRRLVHAALNCPEPPVYAAEESPRRKRRLELAQAKGSAPTQDDSNLDRRNADKSRGETAAKVISHDVQEPARPAYDAGSWTDAELEEAAPPPRQRPLKPPPVRK